MSKFERITIELSLAKKLKPVEVKPGISLATMTVKLNVTNNKYHLDEFDDGSDSKSGIGPPSKRQQKEASPPSVKSGTVKFIFSAACNILLLLSHLSYTEATYVVHHV